MKIYFLKITSFFLLVSSVLGIILSKNLFIQFISISLTALFIYFSIFYIIVLVRNRIKPIEITALYDGETFPLQTAEFRAEIKNEIALFPGVDLYISYRVYENGNFQNKTTANLNKIEKNVYKFDTIFERHGKFVLKEFAVKYRDIFGLTELDVKTSCVKTVSVQPFFSDEIKIPIFSDDGGEVAIKKTAKENSTDFFENRKYFPGDDPRRINWKIYARFNELQIREVEKTPPKIGEIYVIFAPFSDSAYEYEQTSSLFLAMTNYLISNNFTVKALSSSSKEIREIRKYDEKAIREITDNSNRKLENINIPADSRSIIFASFVEFSRIVKDYDLNGSAAFVSYFVNPLTGAKKKDYIFKILARDNIFMELLLRRKIVKDQSKEDTLLEEIKQLSYKKNIELEIYRGSDEIYRNADAKE
ncbi:MAG TPA: DUF58 domain-containing protein [Spirochaetota bacterium]|nr:MAG: hypothetical protein BWX91_01870 [Spirochaetes bacterium ADurb.Bin133]HNZ27304.1 DUF58 domain-containing protein [Spirochaetota bacterium]HPY87438.1 DUF58 domain-containing protein [Spirochaetota bacterium]HQB60669.1 DUF58 domain-containing protein [Spirochaetota bacterium]